MTHIDRRMTRLRSHNQTPSQYWVVGGEYTDTAFSVLHGPAEALGPFADYDHAYQEWERLSMETKPSAHVRYTIVGNIPR
jgi:hypothetical protein